MLKIKKHKNSSEAHIQGDLTIYSAAELKKKLMPVLEDERELEINLADVTELDSAGVQLLMLAKKEKTARGQSIRLTSHSNAVVDIFELMDLVSYFNDPVVLSGEKGEQHGA